MHPYLLNNDQVNHAERLALERYYRDQRGRTVSYKDILHELQHKKWLSLPKTYRESVGSLNADTPARHRRNRRSDRPAAARA
jgi:hypothetical protein